MSLKGLIPIAAFLLFITVSQVAALPQGDFDGLGKSDFIAVRRVASPTAATQWTVRSSENGAVQSFSFPVLADALVMQSQNGVSYPGIVRVTGVNQQLEWRILQPGGTIRTFYFGLPGDIVPNHGYDFGSAGFSVNNPNVSDCVVVRRKGSVLRWFVAPDCDPTRFISFVWGSSGDRPLVGEYFTSGQAAAMVVRPFGPNIQWLARNAAGNLQNSQLFGDKGDIPLIPGVFYGGSEINLALARRGSGGMELWLQRGNGSYVGRALGTNDGIPLTGFDSQVGSSFYGIYDRRNAFGATAYMSGGGSFFAVGGANFWFVSPDGQVYPNNQSPVGVGSVGGTSVGTKGGEEYCGGSVTIGGDTFSSSACNERIAPRDGSGNFAVNPFDIRGTIKVMLPSRYTNLSIKVEGSAPYLDRAPDSKNRGRAYICNEDGSFYDRLTVRKPEEWGNRDRFMGTKPWSSYGKNLTFVVPLTNGNVACAKIFDGTKRQD
jgi:hypothetical protein